MFVDPRYIVVNRLGMVFDWVALYCQYFFGNKRGLVASESIALYGVGIVSEVYSKVLTQVSDKFRREGAKTVKPFLFKAKLC